MNRNHKIALVAGIITLSGISFLLYRRSVNKKNSALFLEYVDGLPKTNTTASSNKVIDDATDLVKGGPIIFSSKVYKDTKAATAVAFSIAKELNKAMSTVNPVYAGTDMKTFENAFKKIGSKNAMILVNAAYKAQYKVSMWEDISEETRLYTGQGVINTIAGAFANLPKYNPVISQVMLNLK